MKFSITIPAYKRTYLKEAIDSCLAQTYKDFELIIVNDASPEDLDSIVLSYSDNRIRYYKNEINCGAINVVDNWNKCLKYAKGEYLICMGDDDRLLPCCLGEYVKLMEKYPSLGVYHAWTEIIDENGDFKNITVARCEYESAYSLIWHRITFHRQQYIGDFLFEIDRLRKNGGFYKLPLAWGADDITAVNASLASGIANTQVITFQYRQNSLTISNTGNLEAKMDGLRGQQKWYDDFLTIQPYNEFDCKLHQLIKNALPSYFEKRLAKDIALGVDKGIISIIRLMCSRKKYNISFKVCFRALIEYNKLRR